MKARIVSIPGDGIGPEVVAVARDVLEATAQKHGHKFTFTEHLLGGCAIDATGNPLPEETLAASQAADAVLFGAIGGPKWDDPTAKVRPEQGLLGIRKGLGLYANLRPIKPNAQLMAASPLKAEKLENVDFIVLRELTGGIYFGEPRERRTVDGHPAAVDTMVYTEPEVERVVNLAFTLARDRKKKVTSVDKANVLESSRLWRETAEKVAANYPDVTYETVLVDAMAMHMLTRPADFDVVVTANLFGDILTDESSVLTGSMGNMPSASLGESTNSVGLPLGLYEPIHGSAPDIAGKGIANPIGAVVSAAFLLRFSLGLEAEAQMIEAAVDKTLAEGWRTADIAGAGEEAISTKKMRDAILSHIE